MKRFLSCILVLMLLFSATLASAEGTGISLEAKVQTFEGTFGATALAGVDENGAALLSFTTPDGIGMTLYYSHESGLVLRNDETGEWSLLTIQGIPLNLPMLQEMLASTGIDFEALFQTLMTAAYTLPALTQEFAASLFTLPSVQALIVKVQTGITTRNITLTESDINNVLDEVAAAALGFVFGEENVQVEVGTYATRILVHAANPALLNELGLGELIALPEETELQLWVFHLNRFELKVQGSLTTGTITFSSVNFTLNAYYHRSLYKGSFMIDGTFMIPQNYNVVEFNATFDETGADISISDITTEITLVLTDGDLFLDVQDSMSHSSIMTLDFFQLGDGFILGIMKDYESIVLNVTAIENGYQAVLYEDDCTVFLKAYQDQKSYNYILEGFAKNGYDLTLADSMAELLIDEKEEYSIPDDDPIFTLSGVYQPAIGYLSAVAEGDTDRYEVIVQSVDESFTINAAHTYSGSRTYAETFTVAAFSDNDAFHFTVNKIDRYGSYYVVDYSLDNSELSFSFEFNDDKTKLSVMKLSDNCLLFQYSTQDLWYGREETYTGIVDTTEGLRIEIYQAGTPIKVTLEIGTETRTDGTTQYYFTIDNHTSYSYKIIAYQIGDTWVVTDGNIALNFTQLSDTTYYIHIEPDAQTAIDLFVDAAAELPEIEAPEIASTFEIMDILGMLMGM